MKFLIFWGVYISLVFIRFGFSVLESYIHPDEHFQGIQVVAGDLLKIKVEYPWEFEGSSPIRSIGPLWIIYVFPLKLAQWMTRDNFVEPLLLFFLLRIFFFGLSFIVGMDWFVYTCTGPRYRRNALLLYASSFVTHTYQIHTFSNSVETIMKHGIHAYWTHFLVNIPILLGPAIFLPIIVRKINFDIYLMNSIMYLIILSLFPHQELRFLLPVFPLLIIYLSSLGNIRKRKLRYLFVFSWVIYNAVIGIFIGFFHQHDIISTIIFLKNYLVDELPVNIVFWKTYPPPTWLFLRHPDSKIVFTHLVGYSAQHVMDYLSTEKQNNTKTIFIFPLSSIAKFSCIFEGLTSDSCKTNIGLRQIFKTSYHITLDDLDFANSNFFFVLLQLIKKKGLGIWEVT
ncbi:hypothetical protein PCANB_001307 [Pneumocystis canis]|nr:hypothetical protein PCANB_001307 [Pneumocystis canis]